MASGAAVLGEKFLPLLGECAAGTATRPGVISCLIEHIHEANHLRVTVAAIFGAEDPVTTRSGSPKPQGIVMAWNHIVTHAKGRHRKAVNDIFRGHCEFYRFTHGPLWGVILPFPMGFLLFPIPCLPTTKISSASFG